MAHKLWEKNFEVNKEIERFTVGRDRELDLYLAKYDVLGSMAHITMLESIGLLEKDELTQLLAELKNIYAIADKGEFVIEDGVEDVHSQVELMLTQKLGDMGKKIHSGLKAVEALRKNGNEIVGMVASYTYGFPIAEKAFADANVKLVTLTDYEHVVAEALETGYIKQEDVELLHEWRKDPANWKK
jgi:hypothetical protein